MPPLIRIRRLITRGNAVAHCPDYDDVRALRLMENAATVPDWAGVVSDEFRAYFARHGIAARSAEPPNRESGEPFSAPRSKTYPVRAAEAADWPALGSSSKTWRGKAGHSH